MKFIYLFFVYGSPKLFCVIFLYTPNYTKVSFLGIVFSQKSLKTEWVLSNNGNVGNIPSFSILLRDWFVDKAYTISEKFCTINYI